MREPRREVKMLNPPEQGCLLVADISGYTGYLAGSELDHAQDVLADLIETVIRNLRPMFRLAKLEGDAAFAYVATDRIDGSMLLDTVEECYFAFRRRLDGIHRFTTCQCNACRQIPTLNLKFFIHHGAFARHKIAGRDELTGTDVILVHRLLKNSVVERFGLRGYGLFTAQCLNAASVEPAALGMREHQEAYEHIGDIVAFVHDLDVRWKETKATRRDYVTHENAAPEIEFHVPAAPPVVWEYYTTAKRLEWVDGMTGLEQKTAGGRRGAGTVNHCAHGEYALVEEILDWRPFQYVTSRFTMPGMGATEFTVELFPEDTGTRVALRRRRGRTKKDREVWQMVGKQALESWSRSFARLNEILAQDQTGGEPTTKNSAATS
ncbi:MAG: DUF2652 domain-containing protein [Armatimonadota bacterium]